MISFKQCHWKLWSHCWLRFYVKGQQGTLNQVPSGTYTGVLFTCACFSNSVYWHFVLSQTNVEVLKPLEQKPNVGPVKDTLFDCITLRVIVTSGVQIKIDIHALLQFYLYLPCIRNIILKYYVQDLLAKFKGKKNLKNNLMY